MTIKELHNMTQEYGWEIIVHSGKLSGFWKCG